MANPVRLCSGCKRGPHSPCEECGKTTCLDMLDAYGAGVEEGRRAMLLQLSRQQQLMCAWCGKPVSALELVERRSMTKQLRFVWHWDCENEDPARQLTDWNELIATVVQRGDGRVGWCREECDG